MSLSKRRRRGSGVREGAVNFRLTVLRGSLIGSHQIFIISTSAYDVIPPVVCVSSNNSECRYRQDGGTREILYACRIIDSRDAHVRCRSTFKVRSSDVDTV